MITLREIFNSILDYNLNGIITGVGITIAVIFVTLFIVYLIFSYKDNLRENPKQAKIGMIITVITFGSLFLLLFWASI